MLVLGMEGTPGSLVHTDVDAVEGSPVAEDDPGYYSIPIQVVAIALCCSLGVLPQVQAVEKD